MKSDVFSMCSCIFIPSEISLDTQAVPRQRESEMSQTRKCVHSRAYAAGRKEALASGKTHATLLDSSWSVCLVTYVNIDIYIYISCIRFLDACELS